jgi:hypothetical protein
MKEVVLTKTIAEPVQIKEEFVNKCKAIRRLAEYCAGLVAGQYLRCKAP